MKIIPIPKVIKGRPVARRTGFFLNGKDNRWSYLVMVTPKFPWIHVWKGKEKKTFSTPPPDHPNCRCVIHPVEEDKDRKAS